MTPAAERLISVIPNPTGWLFPPPKDHPSWIVWNRIWGLPTPVSFVYKPEVVSIGRGWRDSNKCVYYNEWYAAAYRLRAEAARLEALVEHYDTSRKASEAKIHDLQSRLVAADEKQRSAEVERLQNEAALSSVFEQKAAANSLHGTIFPIGGTGIHIGLDYISLANPGDIGNERLVIRAFTDINLSHYVVYDTITRDDGKIYIGNRDGFWFPEKKIKRGDYVVLSTKSGTPQYQRLENGSNCWFCYRGCPEAKYSGASRPVIARIDNWFKA